MNESSLESPADIHTAPIGGLAGVAVSQTKSMLARSNGRRVGRGSDLCRLARPSLQEVHCVAIVQVQELIEAGVHFGHRASRWNPKMRPYIYGKRNLIHIIDLRETVRGLLRAYKFLAKVASRGSLVVFVGTKRQAKEAVEREAPRCRMPYVSERWLGGTLTNYRTIRDRLKRLQELEGLWLPPGDNAGKMNMVAYMRSMLNESGKLELTKAPESAEIR